MEKKRKRNNTFSSTAKEQQNHTGLPVFDLLARYGEDNPSPIATSGRHKNKPKD